MGKFIENLRTKKLIKDLAKDLGAKTYKKGIDWQGYQVYIPQYKGIPCIGHPYVILQKGNEVRRSTPDEGLAYLEYEQETTGGVTVACPICGKKYDGESLVDPCPHCGWIRFGCEEETDPNEYDTVNHTTISKAKANLAKGLDKWGDPLPMD